MKGLRKSILLWIAAFFMALVVMVFQRMTGPTHPVRGSDMFKGEKISYRFLRSSTANQPLRVAIRVNSNKFDALLYSRRYDRVNEYKFQVAEMVHDKSVYSANIKGEDTAGKVEYLVKLIDRETKEEFALNGGKSVISRFKGAVPPIFLISHILFMVLGFIFAMRTLLETVRKEGNYYWLVNWTLGIVFIGGMILGPIVQKYAFGDLWTGIPFGTDLTDNKTLIAFIFWIIAFFMKKRSKTWVIVAVIVMIVIYSIPHSALGSERNYKTGQMNNKYVSIVKPVFDKSSAEIG